MMNELKKKLESHAFRWKAAIQNGIMVNQETEQMKNILLNNLDGIIEAVGLAVEAADKIQCLEAEIDSADAELKELDNEIKKLRSAAASKPAAKSKTKVKAEPRVEADAAADVK